MKQVLDLGWCPRVLLSSVSVTLPGGHKAGLSEPQCLIALLVRQLCSIWHGCLGPPLHACAHTYNLDPIPWVLSSEAELRYTQMHLPLRTKAVSLKQRPLPDLLSPWDELSPRKFLSPSVALASGSLPTISLHRPRHILVLPHRSLSLTCSSHVYTTYLCSYLKK